MGAWGWGGRVRETTNVKRKPLWDEGPVHVLDCGGDFTGLD